MTAHVKYQKNTYTKQLKKEFIQFKRRIEIKYDCMNSKKNIKTEI